MTYAQPKTLNEALELLAAPSWAILSGGTDYHPARLEAPADQQVLDLQALDELKHIEIGNGCVRIGAGVTWSDIIKAPLPAAFDGLKLAAREVGSVQIQNRATLAGNLCNASPAADGVPPLLTLHAEVELQSLSGKRRLPLREFVLGNRQTALREDELLCAILVPDAAVQGRSTFVKLGARKYLVISISMVAGRLVCDQNRVITDAAFAIGSCSVVAQSLPELKAALIGRTLDWNTDSLVLPEHLQALSPIADVRSPAEYRMHASLELTRRVVKTLAGEFL